MLRWPAAPRLAGRRSSASSRNVLSIAAVLLAAVEVYALINSRDDLRGAALAAAGLVVAAVAFGLFLTKPTTILLGGWVAFIAQQPVIGYVGDHSSGGATIVGRLDDAVLLGLAVAMVVRRIIGVAPRGRPTVWLLLLIAVLWFAGVISALLGQDTGPWTVVGSWLSLKIIVVIAAACEMPWTREDYHRATAIALGCGAVVAAFALLDYVSPTTLHSVLHTKFVPNSPLQPARSHYVQSVFQSPSRFSNFMTVVFAIAAARYAVERRYSLLVAALVFGGAGLASLRLRGLLADLAVVCVLIVVIRGGRISRTVQLALAIVACVAVLGPAAFSGQADRFASQASQTARGEMYSQSLDLAEEHFPFGVGFGRFASYASDLYYSPLYDRLGLSYDYGFSRLQPDFITDAGLAGYVAEVGIPGTILFLAGLSILACRLGAMARSAEFGESAAIALAVLVAALVMSLGSASLLDSAVVAPLAIFTGISFALASEPRT